MLLWPLLYGFFVTFVSRNKVFETLKKAFFDLNSQFMEMEICSTKV